LVHALVLVLDDKVLGTTVEFSLNLWTETPCDGKEQSIRFCGRSATGFSK